VARARELERDIANALMAELHDLRPMPVEDGTPSPTEAQETPVLLPGSDDQTSAAPPPEGKAD
jgi:hypothetical protein